MNKLLKTGLLSAALLISAAVNASKIVTVSSPGAKVVNITLSDIAEGETLSILTFDGQSLLKDTLKKTDTYTKTINFAPLEEGVYFLETKKANEVNVTPIFIKENSVSINANLTKTYKAPQVILDGTVAKIYIKNFNKSKVGVSIFDQNGSEINLESSNELIVYRYFDFEKLGSGNYTILVTVDKYNFIEEVKF